MAPVVSVVIPTVGRADRLQATLEAFGRLEPATPEFELIVVLDGDDAASRTVASRGYPFSLTLLDQPRRGIGPARNLGAASARGRYLLFFNDDTRPAPGCLTAHCRAQERIGEAAVLGRIEWDPDHAITPYMAWLAPNGHQFNFGRLTADREIPWSACWATNLSVPAEWLKEIPFDPGFPLPALEDGEWAYRLARSGRPLRFSPDAVCFHHHRYDGPRDFRLRARLAGAAARHVVRRHPRLIWTLVLKPFLAATARTASVVIPRSWRLRLAWDLDYRWNYVAGLLSRQGAHRLSSVG
jgi:GT2 family glycosyltransferase